MSPSTPSPNRSTSSSTQPKDSEKEKRKRNKSSYSCLQCRKNKTRCQLLGSGTKCERCRALTLVCSHESGETVPKALSMSEVTVQGRVDAQSQSHNGVNGVGKGKRKNGARAHTPSEAEESYEEEDQLRPSCPHDRLMWHYLTPSLSDPINWAYPVQAMNDFWARHFPLPLSSPPFLSQAQSDTKTTLRSVFSENEIAYCTSVFETEHAPHLSLGPETLANCRHMALFELVVCTLVLTHRPSILTQSHALLPILNALVHRSLGSLVLSPSAHTGPGTITALLVLCVWPIPGLVTDTSALLSLCVGLARREGMDRDIDSELWTAIQRTESLLLLGTPHRPLSTSFSSFSARTRAKSTRPTSHWATLSSLRPAVLAEMCAAAERGIRISFPRSVSLESGENRQRDIDKWYAEFESVMKDVASLAGVVSPLLAICPSSVPNRSLHLLMFHLHFTALLTSYTAQYTLLSSLYANLPLDCQSRPHIAPTCTGGRNVLPEMTTRCLRGAVGCLECVVVASSSPSGSGSEGWLATLPIYVHTHIILALGVVVAYEILFSPAHYIHRGEVAEEKKEQDKVPSEVVQRLVDRVVDVVAQARSPNTKRLEDMIGYIVERWSAYKDAPPNDFRLGQENGPGDGGNGGVAMGMEIDPETLALLEQVMSGQGGWAGGFGDFEFGSFSLDGGGG